MIARWKNWLPQYNWDFEERRLRQELTPAYPEKFLTVTCRAEVFHDAIAVLGYCSVLFALLCDNPVGNVPLFLGIVPVIGLCNLPFSLIQRDNPADWRGCWLWHVPQWSVPLACQPERSNKQWNLFPPLPPELPPLPSA